MLTSAGRFLRKLRIDNNEILKDMSDKLGVTSSYLSAVENGKREFPKEWEDAISNLYQLSQKQKDDFTRCIIETASTFRLNVSDADSQTRQLAYVFARKFGGLDNKKVEEILKILGSTDDE
jgi:transcriptional regulator with XRE-family HTH domain